MNSKSKEKLDEELMTDQTHGLSEEEMEGQECRNDEDQSSIEGGLEDEVEKLTAQIEEQKGNYLRLSAEFDNYRKRTMKEKADLILNGSEKSIISFLPVIDDLERAIKIPGKCDEAVAIKEGVELIYTKFLSILSQYGVNIIETINQPLDTDYHEAVAVIPAPEKDLKGKILDTVQTGYTMNDKVIRHAKVVVGE